MEEKKINDLIEVGKASADAMYKARDLIKPGVKLLDVAINVEKYLKEKGFGLAFPLNLSLNENAAHYSPSFDDNTIFTEKDIIKIDFGAEKNGMLGDGALTVDLSGKHVKMIEAAEEALQNAIAIVKAGVMVKDIGKIIAETIEKKGYKPIQNLGGHMIEENSLHVGQFIPNYDNGDEAVLLEGDVIAIEPFVTEQKGKGLVKNGDICEIYSYIETGNVRGTEARLLLAEIESNYNKNPFAVRWLSNVVQGRFKLYSGISELVKAGVLEPSPVLVESGKGIVAQAESEMIVEKEGDQDYYKNKIIMF